MRKSKTTTINIFVIFTCLYRKICALLENIFGKVLYCYVYVVAFVLQLFHVSLLEMQ